VITVGGGSIETWTEMTLTRKKDDLTGQLEVTIFAGAMPSKPILAAARAGAPIQVYIAGQLAFTGTVDSRTGSGAHSGDKGTQDSPSGEQADSGGGGGSMTTNIGPNEYTVKISARGKTKRLIDSSHQHPTTNMLKPTTKKVVEKLVEPWKTQLEWLGQDIKLDKVRFRDGARVVDELNRVMTENCYFMYETRDGKLRVTDGVGPSTGGGGDALILGYNILRFSAEQSEHEGKSKIKAKGQRTEKKKWGEEAVLKTFKEVKDSWIKDFVPHTVQHNGDADDQTLERRARFEMNKRNTANKKITIEVFHVQSPSGAPWDVGNTHYVEVPPEGIFDVFECTELKYHVDAHKELKTTLTLSPPPSGGAGGGGGGGGGFGLAALNMNVGRARREQAGIVLPPDGYPQPWGPPQLSELPFTTLEDAIAKGPLTTDYEVKQPAEDLQRTPPLTLPPWFEDK
jgi:prophage tail gpP-like protein